MTCPHCVDAEGLFTGRAARWDRRRYQRRGSRESTRLLVDSISRLLPADGSLLDIGGGVGPIQHDLFDCGLGRAVQVDASRAYLDASKAEAAARGHAGRVEYLHGDFVEVADRVGEADVVTLDRVICCYPALDALVDAAAPKARLALGLVYPRDRWLMRLWFGIGNLFFTLRRSSFRTYIYPEGEIEAAIGRHPLRRVHEVRTAFWSVALYVRTGPVSTAPGAA